MKKFISALTVMTAVFATNAFAQVDISPNNTGGDTRSIYLYVDKMPNVTLNGPVFEQPQMPTAESLSDMSETRLGEMYIKSSAGVCNLLIKTENDFALKSSAMMDSTADMLASYKLNYSNNDTNHDFMSNGDAPLNMDCQSTNGLSVAGVLSLLPVEYNEAAPAGVYRDIVNVTIEVAG